MGQADRPPAVDGSAGIAQSQVGHSSPFGSFLPIPITSSLFWTSRIETDQTSNGPSHMPWNGPFNGRSVACQGINPSSPRPQVLRQRPPVLPRAVATDTRPSACWHAYPRAVSTALLARCMPKTVPTAPTMVGELGATHAPVNRDRCGKRPDYPAGDPARTGTNPSPGR